MTPATVALRDYLRARAALTCARVWAVPTRGEMV